MVAPVELAFQSESIVPPVTKAGRSEGGLVERPRMGEETSNLSFSPFCSFLTLENMSHFKGSQRTQTFLVVCLVLRPLC